MTSPDAPASTPTRTADNGTLAMLTFDGFLCAVLSVLFLPLDIGATPFPVTILLAAVVNLLLVIGARIVTTSARKAALPLVGWLVGFLVCMVPGPGGDLLLLGDWRTLLLLIAAVAPAGVYLFKVTLAAAVARAQAR